MNRREMSQEVKEAGNMSPREAVVWVEFAKHNPGGFWGDFEGHVGRFVASNGSQGVAMADQDGNVMVEFC